MKLLKNNKKSKRIACILAFCAMSSVLLTAPVMNFSTSENVNSLAVNQEIDNIFYELNEENGTAEITGIRRQESDTLEIPEIVESEGKKYRVTAIGEEAFYGNKAFGTVIIPESVTRIEKLAFGCCTRLVSIVFSGNSNLEYIGKEAFESSYLTSINIPSSVKIIDQCAFSNCSLLQNVEFDVENSGLLYIGENAFYENYNLNDKVIILPKAVNLSEGAFPERVEILRGEVGLDEKCVFCVKDNIKYILDDRNNTAFVAEVVNFENLDNERLIIPEIVMKNNKRYKVEEILSGTFAGSGINFLRIPGTVKRIGSEAFYECQKLRQAVITGDSELESLGRSTFENCSVLSEFGFNIISKLKKIDKFAFKNDIELKEINIPKCVEVIEEEAFENCRRFNSLIIPASVKKINDEAFKECENIKLLMFENGSKLEYIGARNFISSQIAGEITFPASLKEIGEAAFCNCRNISGINFERNSKLKEIRRFAFDNNKNLLKLEIPASIEGIGEQAFSRCGLDSITFGPVDINYNNIHRTAFAGNHVNNLRIPVGKKYLFLVDMFFQDAEVETYPLVLRLK